MNAAKFVGLAMLAISLYSAIVVGYTAISVIRESLALLRF